MAPGYLFIKRNLNLFKLIRKYKAVLQFILTFLGTYFILSLVYGWYIKQASSPIFYPDYITHAVAVQSAGVINFLGYSTQIAPFPGEASVKLMVNGHFLIRVVEGCNGMSVIILFCSFVLSFFNGWVKTLLFMLAGAVAVYVINVLRISFLALSLYHYPQFTNFLHEIAFPAVIYGFVFLLWVFWVSRFKMKSA